MSDYSTRPKDDFMNETDWQQLYILTKHWKSDLLFYKDDLNFLHHLIDKYFIWITEPGNLSEVKSIGSQVLADEENCDRLLEKTTEHLSHLGGLMEDPFKYDAVTFRNEHRELEDEIALFIKTVRENRKKVFAVTEHVLDSEQLMHLMDR